MEERPLFQDLGPGEQRDKRLPLLLLRPADHPGDFGQGEGAAVADQGEGFAVIIDDAVGDHRVAPVRVGVREKSKRLGRAARVGDLLKGRSVGDLPAGFEAESVH